MLTAFTLFGLIGCISGSGHTGFEGVWQCKDGDGTTLGFDKIDNRTYQIDFGDNVVFSGDLNDDGVLVIEMMGNLSCFSIKNDGLHFSGILADECTTYTKNE